MESITDREAKTKRSEKRRELFKQQQEAMLQGYNQNSFKSSKTKKHKQPDTIVISDQQSNSFLERRGSKLSSGPATNEDSSRKMQDSSSRRHKKEFNQVLDQISLNSSSKFNGTKEIGNIKIIPKPEKNKSSRKYESSRDRQNLNLSKSQTGLIGSLMNGQPIDMKLRNGSNTMNSSKNAMNSLIETSKIEIELNDELNRQAFEKENPYGHTQKFNMTDYQGRNLKRESSKEKIGKRRRSYKGPSPYEKHEEVRFECFELQQRLNMTNEIVQNLAQQLADINNPAINLQKQTLEVPIDMIEMLTKLTSQNLKEFESVQSKINNNFDDHIRSHSRQRSKNKMMKKHIKDLQNKSLEQVKEQKEIEESLAKISNAHSLHRNLMEEQLDQFENHVNNLRDTRQFLNSNYEIQLDKACKEMVNFYQNLENAEPNEVDSDNMSIEHVFFIKPTSQITQSIQQRSKSHLKISHQAFSNDQMTNNTAPRAHSIGPSRAPHQIPKLQIDRINKAPEPPRIMNLAKSNINSQNRTVNTPPKDEREDFSRKPPTSRPVSNRGPAKSHRKQSSRPGNQLSSRQNTREQHTRRSEKNEKQEEEVFVTNPVMVGAMQMSSRFDNKYEDDDANVTLDMKTERLKQFPEEYEAINSIEDPDQRIILKQVLFLKYEKILKKQAKMERKRKKKALKQQKELAEQHKNSNSQSKQENSATKKSSEGLHFKPKSLVPTPTHKSTFGFGKMKQNINNQSSRGSLKGINHQSSNSSIGRQNIPKGLGMNERPEYNENSQLTSRFSLQSELPPLDTQGIIIAQQIFRAQDVNQSELLDCDEDLALGLKTATQTSLIQHYEDEFRHKEIIRQQLKAEEKKIEHNSTMQSKISYAVKQMSQGSRQHDINKQYNSNQSQGVNLIYIESEANYSINSDLKDIGRVSLKKEQINAKGKNPKLQPADNRSFNNHSMIDQSLNLSIDKMQSHDKDEEDKKLALNNYESRRDDQVLKPTKLQTSESRKVNDESDLSGASNYQRFLDLAQNDYQESPVPNYKMKNSYVNSENTPASQSNPETSNIEDHHIELDIQDFEIQNKRYLDHIGNEFRQRLPLDVIQERQSEFSQSMMTNAKGVVTNRSMQSKNPNHYANLPQNATVQKNQQNSFNFALLSNRDSNVQNQSSANRKNSSRGIMQDSFERKTNELNEEPTRLNMYRSNSVAQTHRNSEQSFVNPPFRDDQPICIDGSLINHSRNYLGKQSSTSKDNGTKKEGLVMFRQPSAGNFERDTRQNFFNNFDQDQQTNLSKQNAQQKAHNQPIPPSGKKQISEKKIISTRNNLITQKSGQNHQCLTSNNEIVETDAKLSGVPQSQMISYLSYNQGGESYRELRDRSYFDESPAIHITHEEVEGDYIINKTRNKDERNTGSSNQIENSIQSNMVSVQVYQTESVDSLNYKKFGTSIGTNQILHSIPQSSGQSSVKATDSKSIKSKHMVSRESHREKESLNQIDSLHHQSANHSDKELLLNSTVHGLNQIKENEEIDLDEPKNYAQNTLRQHCMIRSNSYAQLRDKEFYDMCLDDEDVAIVEQNLFDIINLKQLNQSKQNATNIHNQSSESPAQMLTSNILLNRLTQKIQTQNKTSTQVEVMVGQTPSIVESSQQQTRGQRTFAKYMLDPANRVSNLAQMNYYLGTNMLTKSLDGGTLHLWNNLMHPTLYKKTLLMMANLHNNYLHSVNSGTLFTMQRGWNSGCCGAGDVNPGIGRSFNNLTNMVRLRKEFINNNQSTSGNSGMINGLHGIHNEHQQMLSIKGHQALRSLGGEPVNISHLLLGAKQQTTDKINVGSITIVEDNKNLLDRKLFMDANNSASQPTNGRKMIQSRNEASNQERNTKSSEISNLQTKQLGIFKQRCSQNSMVNFKTNNERKTSESINFSQIINDKAYDQSASITFDNINNKSTPNQVKGIYGMINEIDNNNSSENYSHQKIDNQSTERLDPVNESKSTIKPQNYINNKVHSSENQNKIMNLLAGLKQIQQRNGGNQSTHRSGSDLSINSREVRSTSNFRTIGQMEPKSVPPSESIKKIIKIQQQKQLMNMSSSSISANNILEQVGGNNLVLKSKSVPKVNANQFKRANAAQQSNIVSQQLIKSKDKVKVVLNESLKKNKKSFHITNDETLKNFNTISAQGSAMKKVSSQHNNKLKQQNLPLKNMRTNSSCMQSIPVNGNFMMKKASNVTTISSARGSSNGVMARNPHGENMYVDSSGKMMIKKKISLKNQYKTSIAHPPPREILN